jgi:hypothetical protein
VKLQVLQGMKSPLFKRVEFLKPQLYLLVLEEIFVDDHL